MSKTRHVALIYDATLPYDLKVVEGVADYVHEVGNWCIYIEEHALREQRLPDLRDWQGDGILADFDDARVAKAVTRATIPAVGFGGGYGWHDPASGIPYFYADNQGIARLAAEHLRDRGFRRFAFCGLSRTRINGWSQERADAFSRYVERRGFSCSVYNGRHRTARCWASVLEELSAWLRSLEKPVGIMACHDKRARHVLEACRAVGVHVPEEVAVVGVDDDEMLCRLASPPLSSVRQGTAALGYQAAKLLDNLMAKRRVRRREFVVKPDRVIARQSTDVLAIEDAEVATVVQYIREHACEGIKVSRVLADLGIARSTIEPQFKAIMGRTLHGEIRHVQIARAKDLVATTDLPLKRVAALSGFKSVQYMTTLFHERTGLTPAQFRRAAD